MNEFCVVPDKEFLAIAKKFNLSEGSLKSIMYAYRKNHQGEDPSDDYIALILRGRNPIEDGNNLDYKNAVAVWLKHYSLDTLFTDRELWVDAIKKALLFFPQPSAVVSYLDSKGNFVLHVARPLIKSGNITYNEEQLNAIDAVTLFILDKKSGIGTKTKYITVEGEAGTGKTTIVNLVIRNLAKEGRYMSVHVCAVSNKAVLNIVAKVESAAKGTRIHVEGHSIAAELGAKMDEETGAFKFEDNTSSWKELPIDSAGVIFVDEASMINEEVMEYLDKATKNHPRLAMIFLGDLGQLPPIRSADNPYYAGKAISQNTPSPVFTGANTEVHTLTDRVRLGEGSPILGVTHALHEVDTKDVITDKEFLDVITQNTEDRITSQGAVIYKSSSNQDDIISMVADAFLAAKDTLNPFHAKIVAYRNVTIEGYNKRIRSVVFPNETRELVKGDMIILNNRYEADKDTLTNSQEFVVTSVRDTAKDEYGVTYHELVVKDKTGSYIIRALLQSNKDNFEAFKRAKADLWDLYRAETNPLRKRSLKAKAIEYTYNRYAFIDYGYAITSHKAQGSTYDISIVDMGDINSVSMTSYKTKLQSIYTAITRAANVVMIIGKKDNGSTVDLEEVNKEITSYKQTKKAEPLTTIGNTFEPIDSANDAKRFASKEESKATISSKKTILSNKELALWNAQGVDNMPRILSASERTDPAFHAKEIIDIIEGRKTVPQWGIVNGKRQIIGNLTGKDFAGLYLITKHDGLPMLKLLETKIPKLIHFSITTLGGTQFEPGVMKFNDLLDKILEYINQGLDPDSVTIRIDPIVPGVTKFEDIETVIKRATKMGIKRIRFSIMDAYANTRKAMSSFYDFNKYYDNFHAKQLYIEEIANFMLSMKSKYDITLGTCAEPLVKAGIEKEGCLSVAAVNLMLGTAIEDKGTANNTQRQLCSCYGGKIDALAYNSKCASHCIYCYAKHENEKALEYYNEDGTLKSDEEIEKLMESANQTTDSTQQTNSISTQSGRSDNYTPILKATFVTPKLANEISDQASAKPELANKAPVASILNNSYRLSSAITLSKEMIESQLLPLYAAGMTTFLGFDIIEDDTTTGMRNSQDGTIHINKEGLSNKWLQKLWEDPDSKDTNIPDFQTIEDLITWGLYRVVGEYFVEHKSGERQEDYSNRLNDWATMQTNTISALEAKQIIEEESDEPLTLPKTPVPSVTLTPIEIADSIYRGVYSLHIDTSTADSFGKNTESLKTLINDVPISGLVALPTTPSKALFEVIKFFQKNNMYATSKTIAVNIGDNKELLKAAREAHLIVNEGVVLVPGFIKGLSEEEIILIDLDTKLTKSGLFSSLEIINLAKATMFKVSEFVTMLQSQSSANEILLGDAFKDVDFTKMSRIEIINKVTLTKLLNIVCDRFFDTEMNGNIPFNLWDKADLIRENWQAFILKGFSQLINMEEIAITGKLDVKSELLDTDEYDDEQTVMEIFGNTIEHWQVGFRQISAFSSLSLLIKRTLQKIYVLDADGNQVIDEWGFAKTINPLEAVALILSWTLHAQTIEDMITILKRQAGANPWLNYLVSENTDPNSNIYQLLGGKGKLVGDDELFKSQFFSNFRKYFQKYSIIYKDVDTGEVRIKMINEKSFADLRMLEVMAGYKNPDLGAFPLLRLDGTVNLETLNTFNTLLTAIKSRFDSLTEAEKKTPYGIDSVLAGQLKQLCDILGITGIEEENLKNTLFTTDISTIVKKADYIFDKFNKEVKENPDSNPFTGKRSVLNDYKTIITFVTRSSNEVLEAVSYEAGKMYYSYVLPSYMNRYIEKLKGFTTENDSDKAEAEYQAMMDREFRRFRWFYNQNKKTYRNVWIEKLATDPEVRRMFEHKAALHRFGVNYVDKTPALYTASMILEFFYDTNKRWAWYRVPTLSNKPSEEYIRFIRYHDGYENIITNNLVRTFVLEIERILTVRERNKVLPKDLLIKSFDTNGLKFNFLDFLEEYRDASTERGKTEFGQVLRDALDGKLDLKDGPIFNKLIEGFKTALRENLEERFLEAIVKYRAEGLITEDFSSTYINLGDTPESRREALREFYWNDFFASTQMLQIFITDMAYYKDAEDLQKRLALLHAPGMRANKLAKHMDWGIPGQTDAGLSVSDGYLRTFYLKDSVIKAEVVANLKVLKQKRLAEAKNLQEKNAINVMFSDIIAAFEDTNFADAQAYSSPTSYRKKMNLFGKWDAKLEQAYLNIISGNFATEDLQVIWLPLKPFVYTQISKSSVGIFDTIKMGIQNKNAEYVLIVADALLRSGNMPNRLSAIFDIMEESATDANGKKHNHGIDTVQFESTVKTGLTGIININDDAFDKAPEELTAEDIKNHIRSKIYTIDAEGKTIFNEKYVHDIPVEDYIIQLELPAHFQGEQQQGSLNRILSIADSPNYDANGKENYIVVNGKRITVKEAKQQYFKAAAENIQKSIDLLVKRFLLDSSDIKIQNIAISRLLRDEILRDSRCDNDLLWACSVNKDGEFNIPLSDPTQSNRIQLLLNSIIKNTIDKQKIAGGPVVQVSSYGLSHALHVRWKDKNGNILMTEEEFAELAKPGESYEKYLIDNLYALAYLEAYLPIPSQQFYLDFIDADGNIDLEKVEKYAPDMLKMICYRIPTEGKYSMMPIKVMGFLPINAGEAIMLPAEITKMSGSDFDADKMYVMRHSLQRIVSTDSKGFGEAYEKYLQDNNKEDTTETRIDFVKENGNKYQTVKYQRYSSGREANNDVILDVLWGMLTDPNMLELVWTPGNFDEPKKLGYLIQAFVSEYTRLLSEFEKIEGPLKKPSIDALALYKKLKNMSVDELKELSYKKKNLLYADVQMDFHKLNMIAAKLIGVFAQANVSHAFISLADNDGNPAFITIDNEDGDKTFVLNGHNISGDVPIDRYLNFNEIRTSSILAALLAASVDAVKDPVLNLMNINMNTVNVAVTLIRLGFSIETAALLLSQPAVKNAIMQFERISDTLQFASLSTVISERLGILRKAAGISEVNTDTFTYDDELLIDALVNNVDHVPFVHYRILSLFNRVLNISKYFSMITHMTRYNSITAGVGPHAANTMNRKLLDDNFDKTDALRDVKRVVYNNPILERFRVGAYEIEGKLLGGHIIQASPKFQGILSQLLSIIGFMNDEISDKFSDFFMSYIGNPTFDLSLSNREYMLKEFPKEILAKKKLHPDNLFVKLLQYNAPSEKEEFPTLSINTRGRNDTDLIKAAWGELLKVDEKFALQLAEYSFFRGGFGFNPKTFSSLMPNTVKMALKNYINNLNNFESASESYLTPDYVARLINQFILNNLDLVSVKSLKLLDSKQVLDLRGLERTIGADRFQLLVSHKPITIYYSSFYDIKTKDGKGDKFSFKQVNGLCKAELDGKPVYLYVDKQHVTMLIVDRLGGGQQGFEIDPNVDFPSTIYSEVLQTVSGVVLDSGLAPIPALEDLQATLSAIIFDLYTLEELRQLPERYKTEYKGDIDDILYEILLKYQEAIGRELSESEKLVLYNSGKQTKNIIDILSKNSIEDYQRILNNANKTIKELNLCE